MLVKATSKTVAAMGKLVVVDTEATENLAALVETCRGFMAAVIGISFIVEAATRFLVV
jgi:hypothetical protein